MFQALLAHLQEALHKQQNEKLRACYVSRLLLGLEWNCGLFSGRGKIIFLLENAQTAYRTAFSSATYLVESVGCFPRTGTMKQV
jgi:hypothetical protein